MLYVVCGYAVCCNAPCRAAEPVLAAREKHSAAERQAKAQSSPDSKAEIGRSESLLENSHQRRRVVQTPQKLLSTLPVLRFVIFLLHRQFK